MTSLFPHFTGFSTALSQPAGAGDAGPGEASFPAAPATGMQKKQCTSDQLLHCAMKKRQAQPQQHRASPIPGAGNPLAKVGQTQYNVSVVQLCCCVRVPSHSAQGCGAVVRPAACRILCFRLSIFLEKSIGKSKSACSPAPPGNRHSSLFL